MLRRLVQLLSSNVCSLKIVLFFSTGTSSCQTMYVIRFATFSDKLSEKCTVLGKESRSKRCGVYPGSAQKVSTANELCECAI